MLLGLRLMCITAHPDDESAAFGGALLMANAQGIQTSVVCLTDGQAATFRGNASDGAELGALRKSEFTAACELLGVSRFEVLNYEDGELQRVYFYEVVGVLVERIRRFRPQVVLTFGGEGGVNLHRDHCMAGLLATAAFHWAGQKEYFPEQLAGGMGVFAPQKLYAMHPPFVVARAGIDPGNVAITPCSLMLDVSAYKQKTLDAFLLHHTQRGVLDRVREAFEEHGGQECYWLSASRQLCEGEQRGVDEGMFGGVIEDHAESVL